MQRPPADEVATYAHRWAVVHLVDRQPIWTEGPYATRNEANEVAAKLRREEPRTEDGTDRTIRYRVVGMSHLMSPRAFRRFMASHVKEAA